MLLGAVDGACAHAAQNLRNMSDTLSPAGPSAAAAIGTDGSC